MKLLESTEELFLEAAEFSDEYEDEQKFRRYIEYVLLRAKGFKTYAEELSVYVVNLLDRAEAASMGIPIAAVDVSSRIIYITEEIKDQITNAETAADRKYAEDQLSMLIRHELLHSILRHQYRTTIYIAKKLGFMDPIHLTNEQYQQILKIKRKPALLTGGKVTLGNYAGDIDLSRNYIERDREITRALGGLLMEDHPDWINFSYEHLLEAVEKIETKLQERLTGTVFGTMNPETGEFEIDYEEPAFFEAATEFAADDVISIDLITVDEYLDDLYKYLDSSGYLWLRSDPTVDFRRHVFYKSAKIGTSNVEVGHCRCEEQVFPTFKVENVAFYKQLTDKYNGGTAFIPFKCLGQDVLVKVVDGKVSTIVCTKPVMKAPFLLQDEEVPFKYTVIYDRLQQWFKTQKAKYK